MEGYKGFDMNFKCRDKQYEVGKDYEEPTAKICTSGMHFCENGIDVFGYYPPGESRYAKVIGGGETDKHNDDSKVSCTKLHIEGEVGIHAMVQAGVKFILARVDWKNKKETNTGDQSAATNTGDQSAASVEGKESIACGLGIGNHAKGAKGCWLVLSEWKNKNDEWHIKSVKSVLVDGKKIKADTWYKLVNGKFRKAK